MNEENRKTFFDSWLTEYSGRLQQVCQGIRENMQTLYSETASLSKPTIKGSEPAMPGSRPLNI